MFYSFCHVHLLKWQIYIYSPIILKHWKLIHQNVVVLEKEGEGKDGERVGGVRDERRERGRGKGEERERKERAINQASTLPPDSLDGCWKVKCYPGQRGGNRDKIHLSTTIF